MNKLPRENSTRVQEILNNENFSLEEKAQLIYLFNKDMVARSTNGYLPEIMTDRELIAILKERISE